MFAKVRLKLINANVLDKISRGTNKLTYPIPGSSYAFIKIVTDWFHP